MAPSSTPPAHLGDPMQKPSHGGPGHGRDGPDVRGVLVPAVAPGWQIVDEFNRAFTGQPASNFVAPVHVTDSSNVAGSTSWDPQNGYRDVYRKIWTGAAGG